ncbi:unnamed protein product [Paramecium sonneborni]|uniref:EGF-like domain-containing protein n=1 Tax=Paramecium sonneborni TaxID=65129 RepID=A0A8S1QF71_9CILI|nr:unnamed protein product [Paramecium sonneborni]
MIYWFLVVQTVLGWKDYEQDFRTVFPSGDDLCPEFHVHMPGLHPHQCVSYSQICMGVTEVEAKQFNNFQHLCHPRFQTEQMKYDNITVICTYPYSLIIKLQFEDGLMSYKCEKLKDIELCMVYIAVPRSYTDNQGYDFQCEFCKHPYHKRDCMESKLGFDYEKSKSSPKQCAAQVCESCAGLDCDSCTVGYIEPKQSCSLPCPTYSKVCYLDSTSGQIKSKDTCAKYFGKLGTNCERCGNDIECLSCDFVKSPGNYQYISCHQCASGYQRILKYSGDVQVYVCVNNMNCLYEYQYIVSGSQEKTWDELYEFKTPEYKCNKCEFGYQPAEYIPNVSVKGYCTKFNSDCFQINIKDENICIACLPWHPLLPDGTCSPTTITCSSNCQTCLDTNPLFCTTCDGYKFLTLDVINGTCSCQPPNGQYLDVCKPCQDGYCYECEIHDFYQCITCKPESNRIIVDKQCMCSPGTYDPENEDQICIFCDKSCLNCSSNSECTECLDESISFRILIDNTCPCKIGYAEYEIKDNKCGQCHSRCQTCFQPADETTNQYCLTCIPGENRIVSEDFKCECIDNYGDNNGTENICFTCDYTCGSCQNSQPTGCVSCLETSNRYLTILGQCLCQLQYYDDLTNNIECSRCYYTCQNCANSPEKDACIECPQTRISSNPSAGNYECICEFSNYFDDGFSLTCLPCDFTCLTCNGPLSSNCLTCDKKYRYLDFTSCLCPDKYYDVGELQCGSCHYSCQKCFDDTDNGCIVCSLDLHFRVLKGNFCKCIDGYYEVPGLAQCKKCSFKCETCETTEDKCLTCPLNSLRILDPIKGCQCFGELYDKENEIACQKCHLKCKTCTAYGENQCLSCDSIANRELKVDQCKCQPHYFEMGVQECAICSAFCYECINQFDNCTSCYDDRYLEGNTCICTSKILGGAISTFDFNGQVKCQKCHYSCGSCQGIEQTDCLTCMENENRYQVDNTCVCKNEYFDTGLPQCETCSYKCQECKQQPDSCTSCKDNTFRILVSSFFKCQCIQGYYDDGYNENCQQCHYSCLKCNEIPTKCEFCSIESNRSFNEQFFTCGCNIGYYDSGIEICQKCHYSCLNCSQGDSNFCITCIDSKISNRVFHNNTCKCFLGYFDNGQSVECIKCDIQCLSCIEQSYQCLSCPQTRNIQSNCKCTSCQGDQFRELNLITKTCDCQIGYIEIDGVCQQCQESCQACSQSVDNCTSCGQLRLMKNNTCVCTNGMFESIVDKSCQFCDKTCLTCSQSNTHCLTCSIDNYRTLQPGNICECLQGYFEVPSTKNCEQCEKSCLTCSLLSNNCLTCDSSLHLQLVHNQCSCQQSYYFNSLNKQCEQCHITCLECLNNQSCTQCRQITRHLDQDQMKCLCNDGFYETNLQNCQLCHYSCVTCENIYTHCLSCLDVNKRILINNKCFCLDGYYDAGTELCQKCVDVCKTCQSSASICLSCFDIEQFRILQGDYCLCQPGYYDQNTNICFKCSNECLTCNGSFDYCTSCDTNSKRVDQSIIHKCPCIIGFYSNQDSICQKCHIKCQTCINQFDQCLSCKFEPNTNRMSLSGQCDCKEGYFDDGTQLQCQRCHIKCKLCLYTMDNCLTCANLIRIDQPTCNCMDGFYEDEQLACQMCAPQCDTCQYSPSTCLSCKPGRIGNDCECIDGYLEMGSTLCEQCAFKCATCTQDSKNCKACKGNRIQIPQCICQSGFFDDSINEDCQQCDSKCLECNINGCLSCFANRILNEEMDCVPPPNSIWYNNTPWCSTCQVSVVKIYLSNDISKIIIHFDFPLNSKGFKSQFQLNKCLQLFEKQTVQSFGQNAVCYLNPTNHQEIIIQLGQSPTINVGDEILFISNSVSHVNCLISLQKFIFTTLQVPISPLPPKIDYNVPLHKLNPYAENSVNINSIKNYGFKKLENIVWSCQVEGNEDTQSLIEFLDYINFLQEYNLQIPRNTLPRNSVLKFIVQYQNFIGISSLNEFTLLTHAGDLPQINLSVKSFYFVYEQISISISAGNLDEDKTKYQIQLYEIDKNPKQSLSSGLNISTEANSFEIVYGKILKYTLSGNTTYTFEVFAKNLNSNQIQIQVFTIDIPFAGLICKFNNRGIQSIRKDLNLLIECRDLDTIYEWNKDQDMNIQVSCNDLSLNTTCINQKKQIINVNKTDFVQCIKKNSIPAYTVQKWTINVQKFKQSSEFELIIVYLEEDFPQLELEFNEGYLMRTINNYEQLNFTFLIPVYQKPSLLDLSIAIIYNYEIVEILQPKYLSHFFKIFNSIKALNFGDNVNLKFAAQYTNNIIPSLNNIKLSINQPPTCSKLYITSSSDLALTNIQIATTCQLSDDFPYKYQLRIFLREMDLTDFLQGSSDYSLILYPYQKQNQFSIQTPNSVDSSKIGILLEVLDNGGSITQLFEYINRKPAQLNCFQIQFENLNLQKKVLLLFEAMNQRCEEVHHQIYINLLGQQISSNSNDNILRFQGIKLYKQFLIQIESNKALNRFLNEDIRKNCYDINSSHLFVTKNSIGQFNQTKKIDELKGNINNLDKILQYFIKMKKQNQEEINQNYLAWNQELFQQQENCHESLINSLYYLDQIYLDISVVNTKNEIIFQNIVELLKRINVIVDQIQNTILVNSKPLAIIGTEIFWQIKRKTKQFFNEYFNIESSQVDYLVDFIQFEQLYLQSNPLKFTSDLEVQLQEYFQDPTIGIYPENYYQISLKNAYHNRFISYENFSQLYNLNFGTYKVCSNDTQLLQEYEIQCVMRTISMKFNDCILIKVQKNDTFEFNCQCKNIGDIFLSTSTNFSRVILNSTNEQIADLNISSNVQDLLVLRICTSSLTLIFIIIYIYHLYKGCQKQDQKLYTEEGNLDQQNTQNKNFIYQSSAKIFKEKLKYIHQTISLFCYQEKTIQLSYRILEVFTQSNLLLTLAIIECYLLENQILQICLFVIANPIVIMILRIPFKIIESIYRFGKIAALISQLLLIFFLIIPVPILYLFYLQNISMQSEQHKVFIIFVGNIIISQVLIEPFTIYARIIIYRLIASSIKNMELNPFYHLLHFFVMHSSLDNIIDDFAKI